MSAPRHPRGTRLADRRAIEQWSESVRGQRLLALESGELRRLLPDIFGRHVLQVGSWLGGSALLEGAETLHRAVLGTAIGGNASAVLDPEHLPLPARRVDALIQHHHLQFSSSPPTVIAESAT